MTYPFDRFEISRFYLLRSLAVLFQIACPFQDFYLNYMAFWPLTVETVLFRLDFRLVNIYKRNSIILRRIQLRLIAAVDKHFLMCLLTVLTRGTFLLNHLCIEIIFPAGNEIGKGRDLKNVDFCLNKITCSQCLEWYGRRVDSISRHITFPKMYKRFTLPFRRTQAESWLEKNIQTESPIIENPLIVARPINTLSNQPWMEAVDGRSCD